MEGVGVTVTVPCAVLVQPFCVIEAVQVVVLAGETEMELPVKPPGVHVIVDGFPLVIAVKVPTSPLQIASLLTVKVGGKFTFTTLESVAEQPFKVQFTKYFVVVLGETVILDVVWLFAGGVTHEKAPFGKDGVASICALEPLQISMVSATEIVGTGFTVTLPEPEDKQLFKLY